MGKIFRWTLLFVVLVIFTSGAVAVYTVFFSAEDDIVMPALRGMSVLEAEAEAKRLGLFVKVEQIASSLPEGQVLAQSPDSGTKVRRDRTVILGVSRGAARRTVPDVRNLDVIRAQSAIQEQGFDVGDVIYISDSSRPGGVIIAQSPAAPANVPSDKKIHLLVNQGGPGADGRVQVPDVAQMTEQQARELLMAGGLRVGTVEYVYSPNATDGYVIGTRPAAGTTIRAGEGVRLRIATLKRPEGTPVSVPPMITPPSGGESVAGTTSGTSQVVVTVPGHGDIFVGEGIDANSAAAASGRALDPNVSVLDQRPQVIPNPSLPSGGSSSAQAGTQPGVAVQPVEPRPQVTTPQGGSAQGGTPLPANVQPMGGKIARIRYQVPPLSRSLPLKIEMVDPSGTRVLLERDAKSGEYVSLDAPYSKECAITIYLGGEFVWQDRYM